MNDLGKKNHLIVAFFISSFVDAGSVVAERMANAVLESRRERKTILK